MSIFDKLWLVLLMMLVVIVFVITANFIQVMFDNMVTSHRMNKLKLKMIKNLSNQKNKEVKHNLDTAADFVKSHTDDELRDSWNDFFDGNPPFELDIDELREQAEDYAETKDK